MTDITPWSNLPTASNVNAFLDRVKKVSWFKPMKTVPQKDVEKTVKLACKLFGVEASVEYRTLEKTSDWEAAWDAARGAARGAAWGAAWDAARGAARGAAWEVVGDIESLKKKYPKNPYAALFELWEMGFYVCGVINGKFILYYVPEKKC